MIPYKSPKFDESSFNCPICNAYADQAWSSIYFKIGGGITMANSSSLSRCNHCREYSFWVEDKLIYPNISTAPFPSIDLPQEIKKDFEEARIILNQSPRGAAALLRLCIQKLCGALGESGKDINKDIGSLVKKGLPIRVQQSLDIVRVIGNDAVHPGQIDLTDDIETATKLFNLINIIVDVMITQPKEIDNMFNALPENKLEGIKNRDIQK
jgi:hypothetical protein